jgi:hypothetical protein
MSAYRNPRNRSTTAHHIAQTDRRRAEHEARQTDAAGLRPEPTISADAAAAYRMLIGPAAELSRRLRAEDDAEAARLQASRDEIARLRAAGITPPRPPRIGEA